jgi:predicted short-subunit dehydrogenase-like oxidoreductase (DUF2520 family)
MQKSLSIVGAGRVGRGLGRLLRESDWRIEAVVTTKQATARHAVRFIGGGRPHAAMTRGTLTSSVILITTRDDQILAAANELARIGGEELRGKVVLHTSGALDSSALHVLRKHGAAVGSMHPMQSFSGVGTPPLAGRIFTIEGDLAAVRVARQIVRALGGSPVQIDGASKAVYHAAGAMAAGHVLAVMEAATCLLTSIGMSRNVAARALLPLTQQVLSNFAGIGAHAAWTGPLSRGDFGVVQAHTAALHDFPAEVEEAYAALNRLAARVLASNPEAMLAELQRISASTQVKAKSIGGKA